jgi:hypothetical protein
MVMLFNNVADLWFCQFVYYLCIRPLTYWCSCSEPNILRCRFKRAFFRYFFARCQPMDPSTTLGTIQVLMILSENVRSRRNTKGALRPMRRFSSSVRSVSLTVLSCLAFDILEPLHALTIFPLLTTASAVERSLVSLRPWVFGVLRAFSSF